MRYGFHGLSYESLVGTLGAALPRTRGLRASRQRLERPAPCATGRSIDTSMGFTPTGGIPMGTRSGDLDPGVVLFLMRTASLDADALETLLNHACGMLALAGQSADMQRLLERRDAGDADAALAIDVFCTGVRKQIGAYAALMGGIDLLVFTGGIGEHSKTIRDAITSGLECLGLRESGDAASTIRVVPAAEERQIAHHCRVLLASRAPA